MGLNLANDDQLRTLADAVNASTRELLAWLMKRHDIAVATWPEARSLLRACRDYRPGFVILDLDMPNMNGEQAFRRLVEIDPEVKVIISSGYVLRERESQLRKAGVYGFLNKPYDSMTLMTTIAKALRERRAGP